MNRSMSPQKPTFNIVPPFLGVTVLQLNHSMSHELQKFIGSIEESDVEQEMAAFKAALRDPINEGAYVFKEGPCFSIIRSFKGVVLAELNEEMRQLLIEFISDIEGGVDKIIWALKLALEDPDTTRTIRIRKQALRRRVIRSKPSSNDGSWVPNREPDRFEDREEVRDYE